MNVAEVSLTLVLMVTYITLMIWLGHLMRLPLIRLDITLTIITIPLIGKLTAYLHLQESTLRNRPVDCVYEASKFLSVR
jgi:hypothetical protein